MFRLSLRSAFVALFSACLGLANLALADDNSKDLLQQPGVVAAEFIFDKAPFRECHASTIVETPTSLAAAWFGGTRERDPDVGIWLSRRIAGSWTSPIEVATGIQYKRDDGTEKRYACWNPVLFEPKSGPLLLFYKVGPSPGAWWGMMMTSTDGGANWSAPKRLPEGILGPTKNKPVQIADGTVVCPSSTEDNGWRLHLERTADLGASWSRSEALNDGHDVGAIQPTILFYPNHDWQILARDRHNMGHIWTTWSRDAGKTWSALKPTQLPNPNSGIDAVTLIDGRQLLAYNHTQRTSEFASSGDSRSLLNVAVSRDGEHWQAALVLEHEPGQHSYPAVIQTSDGKVHITYTSKRERIKYVVIDPGMLKLKPIVDGVWPK